VLPRFLAQYVPEHSCIDLGTGLNSAVDLFLALFATLVFWNLKLALRIKISLAILLSLGIV
jgi:hypothetical protein